MYRIAVYAIAKNEEKHVGRWYESAKYADGVFVLDTGSTDNTNEELRKRNINVFEALVQPFRFDTARNMVLNQIDNEHYDFALFLDLDEVLEPNWYSKLQSALLEHPHASGVNTRMIYTEKGDGTPEITYNRLMVTRVGQYEWKYPVHEVLVPKSDVQSDEIYTDIRVRHLPDESKARSSYLKLLEIGVRENPRDPRCSQYLAREYFSVERHEDALEEYARHLSLERNQWFRSESYRNMAHCYEILGHTLEARNCHMLSCSEAPDIRESWAEAAAFFYRMERMHSALGCIENMFDVEQPPSHSIIRNDSYYTSWPHHMAAMCYYRLGNDEKARQQIQIAFRLSPADPAIASDLMTICDIKV